MGLASSRRFHTMRPLFHYAYDCAQAGRLWTAFRHTDGEGGVAHGAAEAQKTPCPADDAFIGYFASR